MILSLLFILGPELPFIDDSNCTNTDGNFTCETVLDNVVDVFYFDAADTFSCKDQVCFCYSDQMKWQKICFMEKPKIPSVGEHFQQNEKKTLSKH